MIVKNITLNYSIYKRSVKMKLLKMLFILFVVGFSCFFSVLNAKENDKGKQDNDKNKIEKMHKKFIKNGGSEAGFKMLQESLNKIKLIAKDDSMKIKKKYKEEMEKLIAVKDFDSEAYNKLLEEMLVEKNEISKKVHGIVAELMPKLSVKDRQEAIKILHSHIHGEK
jgi:Spy/CpxP family protein refolding chaperone